MKFRNLVAATILALSPLAAQAATIVVPAAGTGPGAFQSRWQSELTLHNIADHAITTTLTFRNGSTASAPVTIEVAPRATVAIADIVKTRFGLEAATGAITIDVADKDVNHLAVNSRTFNTNGVTDYGQDVPAFNVNDSATDADIVVLTAPSSVAHYRFNFGLYTVTGAEVNWQLVRADGTVAAERTLSYAAASHAQYNAGVQTLLGVTPQNNDIVYAQLQSGRAIFYGSAIHEAGDPTFVPGIRTREAVRVQFAGIDIDEDGTIDIADADGDGVLDASLDLVTSMFPTFFRVVAGGFNGGSAQLEIVSSPAAIRLVGGDLVQIAPTGELKGKTGEVKIRATAEGHDAVLTIPVTFR